MRFTKLVSISPMFQCSFCPSRSLKHQNTVKSILRFWDLCVECRMLMKLSPWVDFINVLRNAFMLVDPKSVKWYWQLDWALTLSGSTSAKAVCRTLMKLSPGFGQKKSCHCCHYIHFILTLSKSTHQIFFSPLFIHLTFVLLLPRL